MSSGWDGLYLHACLSPRSKCELLKGQAWSYLLGSFRTQHLQNPAQYLDHRTLKKCVLDPKMQRDPAMIQRTWCEVPEKGNDRFYLHEQVGNWKRENLTDLANYGVPFLLPFYPTWAANLWPRLEECPLSSFCDLRWAKITSSTQRWKMLPTPNTLRSQSGGGPRTSSPTRKNTTDPINLSAAKLWLATFLRERWADINNYGAEG